MPTYKNIRIPKRGGGTRLQRVQVLASGKYKFVKNLTTKAKASSKRSKGKVAKKNNKSRAKALLGKYGAVGMAEDLAWGYAGSQVLMGMGYPLESALPMARLAQGLAGKAVGRRGSGRLEYAVLDLVDVYLIRKGFNLKNISLKAWM